MHPPHPCGATPLPPRPRPQIEDADGRSLCARQVRTEQLDAAGMVWDLHAKTWEESLRAFLEIERDEKGRRIVVQSHITSDGFKLGWWQHTQRQTYKSGVLSAERVAKLEAAGIVWDIVEEAWQEGFARFMAFEPNERGLRMVPQVYQDATGFRLGVWQHAQRQAMRKGALSQAHADRLKKAGFVLDAQEVVWEGLYKLFLKIPEDDKGRRWADGGVKELRLWQNAQRVARRKGYLSAERLHRLEAAGFIFDPHEVAWADAYEEFLKVTPDENGKRVVLQSLVVNGVKLGSWQDAQRQAYKKGSIAPERVSKLEAAGMVWDMLDMQWEYGFSQFLKYPRDRYGLRSVPTLYMSADGFKLGAWLTTQRQNYKIGRLTAARIERLEEQGIIWSMRQPSGSAADARAAVCAEKPIPGGRRLERQALIVEEAPMNEDEWHREWRHRLSCWWVGLPGPTQGDLGHCLGALSLHLGARLEKMIGRPLPASPRGGAAAESGCEWLEAATEELQMPDFPKIADFEFSLPPIPRLMPPWTQLQMHSRITPAVEPQQREDEFPLSPSAIGVTFGVGTAAFVLTALLIGRRACRRACNRKASLDFTA